MAANYRGSPISVEPIVRNLCKKALDHCIFRSRTERLTRSAAEECINQQKITIKSDYPAAAHIVDEYNWVIPPYMLGGKRRRRTMHRKRSHKKNSSRRNRRVRQ